MNVQEFNQLTVGERETFDTVFKLYDRRKF